MRQASAASSRTTPPPGAPAPIPGPGAHPAPHYPPYTECFGCAPRHPAGLRLDVTRTGPLELVAVLIIDDRQQGAPGVAHGGVLAAAVDEAIGLLMWSLGRRCATARLETDYVAPVPVGATLVIRAVCTGTAGRKLYAEATAHLGELDGPVAVRAAALYVELPAADTGSGSTP
ncbi:PaaI family thioesterase [Dactylosporangium sp. NPDC051541]|uniref:PaaI family thioesterase n=1 Tax=Dactylosporangium sp. NPDC051541 TaxID=3363977 RepID=UPI0037B63D49